MPTSIPLNELAVELSRVRNQRKLSLREVAEETRVSASTLSRLERGQVPDSKRVIEKIADWLGVSVETGGGGAESRQPRDELRRSLEVYLRAEKNLSEEVARAIADVAEAVMEHETRRRTEESDG